MSATKKMSFWKRELYGAKRVGQFAVQAGKEISTIPAYAASELTKKSPHTKTKCKLKKGWFE
ncbi:MAG: hypothetical protein AAFR75_13840 [Pseudomonadota bacterium]